MPAGPDGEPDPVLVRGRELYSTHCANCHAGDGGGNQGPKLADGAMVAAYPIAEMVTVVTEGRAEMPGFSGQLTAAEIEAVIRYTREVL